MALSVILIILTLSYLAAEVIWGGSRSKVTRYASPFRNHNRY